MSEKIKSSVEELQKKIEDMIKAAEESGASEKIKSEVEELRKKVEDMGRLAEGYKFELEETIKTKPLESAGLIFIVGLILGILLGTTTSKRS